MNDPLRIGLLGGSFNPAHEGHREISLAALSVLKLDAVWWLVSPGNPLKDPSVYAPYEERLKKARRVAAHPDLIISNFEERRGLSYTIDTLDALVDTQPETNFVWLMGADSLANFHAWRDWRRIAATVPIAVFSRPGHERADEEAPAAKELAIFRFSEAQAHLLAGTEPPAWTYVTSTANPQSSTALRDGRS